MNREPLNPMANLIYAAMLPSLQVIADQHGYALAIHGSMTFDFDLVAIPWAPVVSSAESLIMALSEVANPAHGYSDVLKLYEGKPHGRKAWVIPMEGGFALDVSVMPCAKEEVDEN